MNNQLTIIGHVGQTPRAVTFPDTGNSVVKFSVAVTDYSSKKEDAEPMWIDVDAWNGLGERVLKYVTDGREICCTGKLAINKFKTNQDGVTIEKHKPVLKLSGFHLCGPKDKSANAESDVVSPTKIKRRKSA